MAVERRVALSEKRVRHGKSKNALLSSHAPADKQPTVINRSVNYLSIRPPACMMDVVIAARVD